MCVCDKYNALCWFWIEFLKFDDMDYLMTRTENRVWEQQSLHAYIHTYIHMSMCVCVCVYSNEVRILYVFLSLLKTQKQNGLI